MEGPAFEFIIIVLADLQSITDANFISSGTTDHVNFQFEKVS